MDDSRRGQPGYFPTSQPHPLRAAASHRCGLAHIDWGQCFALEHFPSVSHRPMSGMPAWNQMCRRYRVPEQRTRPQWSAGTQAASVAQKHPRRSRDQVIRQFLFFRGWFFYCGDWKIIMRVLLRGQQLKEFRHDGNSQYRYIKIVECSNLHSAA